MSSNASSTPFPLGAYLANPDNTSAANEATFEKDYSSFNSLTGTSPQFLDVFIDQTQAVSQWAGNSGFDAASFAASSDASKTTSVIALPLSSTASGALTPDQSYQAFASGQYDSVIQGIVRAWASQGFSNLVFRPGWEMNLAGPTYAGDSTQDQADWVSAFQHVYTVLHQAAAADGVNVQVMWNPSVTNYSNAEATTNIYPGNKYVDVIGADDYSDIYPYSDGNNAEGQPTYHDWDTGGEDTSVAQFIADPINREHYWTYPAATEYSNDGSDGHSQSLDSLIQFAEQQGKPFALPETGAGNSNSGTDVSDDAAFPQWLAQQLKTGQASGLNVELVNLWNSNGGGNYQFSFDSDDKPGEAAAWAKYFGAETTTAMPAVATPGFGTDVLALSVAEDAWEGDAQFTISVDGTQIGGVQTATAIQSAGQTQTFDVSGNFGAGQHSVSVDFLNDAYGGSSSTDRNLYVGSAAINGQSISGGALSLLKGGSQSFSFTGTEATTPLTVGSGADTLALSVDEDACMGDAQFTVSVDGTQIGSNQTSTAIRSTGQTQQLDVMGDFAPGNHTVSVDFLNDAYGSSSTTDRNLYVSGATIDGTSIINSALSLLNNGSQAFNFNNAVPATSDTLDLQVAEDAWEGDAEYTVSVNGITIGGVHTATASHAAGATQDLSLAGNWGTNPTIGITFINDAYGGSAATDRNLCVDGATYDGQALDGAPATLLRNGTVTLAPPQGTTAVGLSLSEDAWNGDAQYRVSIDGKTLVQDGTVTALRAQSASQTVDLLSSLVPGMHDVAVSFLNDAYGGSASTDRNLYVTGLSVNGSTVPGAVATLWSDGTQHFHITLPAAS